MRMIDARRMPEDKIEFVKGCPLCELSDPELEKEVEELARWLYAVMLADRKRGSAQSPNVDNVPRISTLKERSIQTNQHNE